MMRVGGNKEQMTRGGRKIKWYYGIVFSESYGNRL